MGCSRFDYTLASDLARESARAQRRFERELKRQQDEIRRATFPEPPTSMTKLFGIAPVRLVQP